MKKVTCRNPYAIPRSKSISGNSYPAVLCEILSLLRLVTKRKKRRETETERERERERETETETETEREREREVERKIWSEG